MLLEAASRLLLTCLQHAIGNAILEGVKADTTNFPAAWQLAEQFSLPRLAESVKAAALQDFGKLAPSGALYELTAEQLESLLREDELCCKEEFVFDAVTRWCAEAQANDEVAGRLLSFVRFALLPLTYLEQHVEKTPLMLAAIGARAYVKNEKQTYDIAPRNAMICEGPKSGGDKRVLEVGLSRGLWPLHYKANAASSECAPRAPPPRPRCWSPPQTGRMEPRCRHPPRCRP